MLLLAPWLTQRSPHEGHSPINRTAVDERWELPQALPERITNG
jgi:hypothetical protein